MSTTNFTPGEGLHGGYGGASGGINFEEESTFFVFGVGIIPG
ncbi:hypothetical protein [Rothia dentocariosa]|nr:hypothetical protein [Rothia dentocariosa]